MIDVEAAERLADDVLTIVKVLCVDLEILAIRYVKSEVNLLLGKVKF